MRHLATTFLPPAFLPRRLVCRMGPDGTGRVPNDVGPQVLDASVVRGNQKIPNMFQDISFDFKWGGSSNQSQVHRYKASTVAMGTLQPLKSCSPVLNSTVAPNCLANDKHCQPNGQYKRADSIWTGNEQWRTKRRRRKWREEEAEEQEEEETRNRRMRRMRRRQRRKRRSD